MTARRDRWTRGALAALAAVAVAAVLPGAPSGAEGPIPGSAGVDTSLPLTESAVTVQGRGEFADLEITVNQTENLVNQAISISWRGAEPTGAAISQWDENYLQVMQCWGEPDDLVPENPGPPPEQCVFGAADAVHGGRLRDFTDGNYTLTRTISQRDWPNYDPDVGVVEEATGLVWRPFRAVDGTVVSDFIDESFAPNVEGGQYWLNPYFNSVTTNEIPGARTMDDGRGGELFEVHTGLESSGLGCGQRVQRVTGAEPEIPRCWLVVVPRGDARPENVGRPTPSLNFPIATSPLAPAAWANRIAIPLEFTPLDTPCDLADEQRRINGTEMLLTAVANWQPVLCADADSSPYAYGISGDSLARQQLVTGATGGPGMIAVQQPLAEDAVVEENPAVYAPLAASGLVIGFNVERVPVAPSDPVQARNAGVRVADINLTPRLVAKLLTQSYRSQTAIREPTPYEWAEENPVNLALDPDFLRFNPEFEILQAGASRNFGGLVVPAGSADLVVQLWEWILADDEAATWLAGEPDEWGMQVNPVYSTDPDLNPTGAPFGTPITDSFLKSDPHCHQAPDQGAGGTVTPPLLCGPDWLPYAGGLREAAQITRVADDRARIELDPFALSPDRVYRRGGPQVPGRRSILSVTDTPSAIRYGVQTARLSRSDDGGEDREFVAADERSMVRAVRAMTPDDAGFRSLEPIDVPAGAYPLTTLTYGVLTPMQLDERARPEYARFIEYAAGPGQDPGLGLGQLLPGYAPLPPELRQQALAAAATVRDPDALVAPSPPQEPPPTTTTTVAAVAPVTPPPAAPPAGGSAVPPAPDAPAAGGDQDVPPPVVDDGAEPAPDVGDGDVAAPTAPVSDRPTPVAAIGSSRFLFPVLGSLALLSALGFLEITKRPRRRVATDDAPPNT